jgi:hypothetical protein
MKRQKSEKKEERNREGRNEKEMERNGDEDREPKKGDLQMKKKEMERVCARR